MIANIGRGENLLGAIAYNLLKVQKENGQILSTHKMIETLNGQYTTAQLLRSFQPYLIANNKTEKPVLHISLNPNPKDDVSDEKFRAMAQDYMNEMGYGNQPFVVFKHTDIERTHIHIVSVCVDENGAKISDRFDKRRSVRITRALEEKYGLLPTVEGSPQNNRIFRPLDHTAGDLKSQIASVVRHLPSYYRMQSLGEYNALLSLFNITAEEISGQLHGQQKQGLVYFALNEHGDKISNPFKASLFGKNAGYKTLHKHLEHCQESLKTDPAKSLLKNLIGQALQTSSDEASFRTDLQQKGINIVLRRNDTGRIYGVTFIDHNSKTVWNGSRLGKEFSANTFNDWWNNHHKPQIKGISSKDHNDEKASFKNVHSDHKLHHSLFDFLYNEPDLIEGIGTLFPEALGENYEELVFENLIKRRKKRKR